MLNRRAIWLLAAVTALGCAYVVPGVRAEQGAEICAIASSPREHCEHQLIGRRQQIHAERETSPLSIYSRPSQTERVEWPAAYQRPPTRNL